MGYLSENRKLYEKQRRPDFRLAARSTAQHTVKVLSSPLVALVIAICAWTIPSENAKRLLHWSLAVLALFPLWILLDYFLRWRRYVQTLEDKLGAFRALVLKNANVDDLPGNDYTYAVSGIADVDGTVHLVIPMKASDGLRVGSRLFAVHTSTDEVWGTVEITLIDKAAARAKPIDRAKPEFWENLEDRMRKNPEPPVGFHLEPAVTFAPLKRKIIKKRSTRG